MAQIIYNLNMMLNYCKGALPKKEDLKYIMPVIREYVKHPCIEVYRITDRIDEEILRRQFNVSRKVFDDCWFVIYNDNAFDFCLKSSCLLCISKQTGKVTHSGCCGDEG